MKINATKANQAKIAQLMTNGALLLAVEYRSSRTETISYKDKTTGKAESFRKCSLACEAGPKQITLDARLPRGMEDEVLVELVKGKTYFIALSSYLERAGHTEASFVPSTETVFEMAN